MTEKKILKRFILIQMAFVLLVVALFVFANRVNKVNMARHVSEQIQSHLKSSPSREIPEALSSAQENSFEAIGYFDERDNRVFTFPASLSPSYFSNRGLLDFLFNGSTEIDIFYDIDEQKKAGTLRYTFSRFSYVGYALIFWLLCLFSTFFLFRHYKRIWLELIEASESHKRSLAVGKIIEQVDHDLKSPIQTLFSVVDDSDQMPTADKNSIYSAIDRIKGITGDLRSIANGKVELEENTNQDTPDLTLFSAALKQICDEKKVAYRDHNILVSLNINPKSLTKFRALPETSFMRVCSNLLRNSFEAIQSKFDGKPGGQITVSLDFDQEKVKISIRDNGIGISEIDLPKIFIDGFTNGKENGEGIGLYHAKCTVADWEGDIKTESELGQWTQFEMTIPIIETNQQVFENSFDPGGFKKILVIDDDRSVFERWSRRLSQFKGKIVFVSKPENITPHLENIRNGTCLALVDQEIRGAKATGLQTIRKYQIEKNSILVTNGFSNTNLLKSRLNGPNVRIIPKPLIEYVSISEQ